MVEQVFDVIVVGAGPAGTACSYKLAKAGLNILLLERGKYAGAKNMWGGAFFGPSLNELIPDFWKEAPIERFVSRHRISLLSQESCFSVEFGSSNYDRPPYEGFISFRAKFDLWLASKAEEAGVTIASGLQADDLMWEGERVIGVISGSDKLPANVVIACDGVNSLLAQKAKLRQEIKPRDIKQGVKEVIEFAPGVIEQRYGLTGNAGISWQCIGDFTRGIPGGAFIYSNKSSISVGIVVLLSGLSGKEFSANDLLNDFKNHPTMAALFEGGKLVEYSAHLIPTSGIDMMPTLYTDGFLIAGDAAALVLGTGLILEGANFAIASGVAAADTVIRARKIPDYSKSTLAYYQELLEKSFVLKDLRTFRKSHDFLNNPRIYRNYPELACKFAETVFSSQGKPRQRTWNVLRNTMKNKASLWQIACDILRAKNSI